MASPASVLRSARGDDLQAWTDVCSAEMLRAFKPVVHGFGGFFRTSNQTRSFRNPQGPAIVLTAWSARMGRHRIFAPASLTVETSQRVFLRGKM